MSLTRILKETLYDPDTHFRDNSDAEFGNFFDRPLSSDTKKSLKAYYGRNVIWYSPQGKTIRVHKDSVIPVDGNIFDSKKVNAVANYIRESEDRVEFETGYGDVTLIDLTYIMESLQNDIDDYMQDKPFSTGDEQLDKVLSGEWAEEHAPRYKFEQFLEIFNPDKLKNIYDKEGIVSKLQEKYKDYVDDYNEDPEEYEEDLELIEEYIELVDEIYEAERIGDGDFGRVVVTLRDGNHRTFGAIKSGEEHVFVEVTKNSLSQMEPELKSKII